MNKEKKDILLELGKIRNMVKDKLQKDGRFPPFAISYSLVSGSKMAQMEPWESEDEQVKIFTNTIQWLKENAPYGIIFASLGTKKTFDNKEDYENDVNGHKMPGIIIVAKTPDETYQMEITWDIKKEDDKECYEFKESMVDVTGLDKPTFLDEVFKGLQ